MPGGMAAGAPDGAEPGTSLERSDLPDLLDRIQEEIGERLDASREAVREYERLQAALEALDGAARPASRGDRSQTTPVARSRARRRAQSGGAPKRAPRGANREAVLQVVGEACDGPTALAEVERLSPAVVLLDVQLPGEDGFAVADRLARASNPPAVVLVSTRSASAYGPYLTTTSARGFIAKSDLSGERLAALLE